ncbi:MAG TPA: protein archease [Nitrospiraceae bacterium]|nr:protein archease [Nitrospiraceae bacterium]
MFDIIDISGDVGIRAFGKSIEEVFKNSAIGMYSLITDLEGVKADKNISISVESNSLEGLLVSWLNELVFQFDTYNFIGKDITISAFSIQPSALKAEIRGEEFDTERHERKLLIKAATYHRLKVEKAGDVWQADIIFDI